MGSSKATVITAGTNKYLLLERERAHCHGRARPMPTKKEDAPQMNPGDESMKESELLNGSPTYMKSPGRPRS
jgi:hypothetical protein